MQSLKPIEEQVIVITGASSGIGRETALHVAERGAAVVAIARNREALDSLRREIEAKGGRAHAIVADVSDWTRVQHAADEAAGRFGRIDTWVNNAAVSLYGTVEKATVEEMRRLIDVILMGQIHGVKAALPHLRQQGRGAIINVSSLLGKRSVPLQAAYCAAKHGVKGFTDSLRMELEHEESGIQVTLIVPSSVDTPLFEHARSKMGVKPKPIPPVYAPRAVAQAIAFAAENPRREITVGSGGKVLDVLERVNPRLADAFLLQRGWGFRQQRTEEPPTGGDNLFDAMEEQGRTTGEFGAQSRPRSTYTRLVGEHPARTRLIALGTVVAVGALLGAAGARLVRAGRGTGPEDVSSFLDREDYERSKAEM